MQTNKNEQNQDKSLDQEIDEVFAELDEVNKELIVVIACDKKDRAATRSLYHSKFGSSRNNTSQTKKIPVIIIRHILNTRLFLGEIFIFR